MTHQPKTKRFPPIIRIPTDAIGNPNIRAYIRAAGQELYRMGLLNIWVKRNGNDEWDLSISHPKRYPTWDEVAHARFSLLPADRCYAMLLPPSQDYFSFAPNMFHLTEIYTADMNAAKQHLYQLGQRRELDPNTITLAMNAARPEDLISLREYLGDQNATEQHPPKQ